MTVLVTGGSGFIGSALVRHLIHDLNESVVNVDKMTYAATAGSTNSVAQSPNYSFEQVDICDSAAIQNVLQKYQPRAIIHLAAESHVDRSINGSGDFVQTNIVGTWTMLEAARAYVAANAPEGFRFLHVSTDEVFGTLGDDGAFTEESPYQPNSPYSASKAASDHLVRAWHHTYGLPTIITNCSNNYGPYQFPEKLIPVVITNAIAGLPIPVYGRGQNVRDWLYVDDHVRALTTILEKGTVGETYNVGGDNESTNLDLVRKICQYIDEIQPDSPHSPHEGLIQFVENRLGHDWRYAIDASKLQSELGWTAQTSLDEGLKKTVSWYIENSAWCEEAKANANRLESGE